MKGELDDLWLAGNVDLAAPSCYRRKSRGRCLSLLPRRIRSRG